MEKLIRQSEQQLQQVAAGTHALRATCYGQDRFVEMSPNYVMHVVHCACEVIHVLFKKNLYHYFDIFG